jgi:hypothetical protein
MYRTRFAGSTDATLIAGDGYGLSVSSDVVADSVGVKVGKRLIEKSGDPSRQTKR